MKQVDGLFVGWLDTSIRAVVAQHGYAFTSFESVVVTSLDSESDIRKSRAGPAIIQQHKDCRFDGRALLVPGPLIAELVTVFGLFTGFDEVWCYAIGAPKSAKPSGLSIVGPKRLDSEPVP